MIKQIEEWKAEEIQNRLEYVQKIIELEEKLRAKLGRDYVYCGEWQAIGKIWIGLKRSSKARQVEVITKLVNALYNKLQAKVESKMGKINGIRWNTSDKWAFDCENGTCEVRVIIAGGYNIQCAHTRWLLIK